ncbi:hypothetical protein JW992_05360 [candidate division KSB1 bacterium]|nr:hypothetical protein [candidate division KSB1 bacterium]
MGSAERIAKPNAQTRTELHVHFSPPAAEPESGNRVRQHALEPNQQTPFRKKRLVLTASTPSLSVGGKRPTPSMCLFLSSCVSGCRNEANHRTDSRLRLNRTAVGEEHDQRLEPGTKRQRRICGAHL